MGERCWFAHFNVDGDFSQLLPLFNQRQMKPCTMILLNIFSFNWTISSVRFTRPTWLYQGFFMAENKPLNLHSGLLIILTNWNAINLE